MRRPRGLVGMVSGPSSSPSPGSAVEMVPFDSMLWAPSKAERDRRTPPSMAILCWGRPTCLSSAHLDAYEEKSPRPGGSASDNLHEQVTRREGVTQSAHHLQSRRMSKRKN